MPTVFADPYKFFVKNRGKAQPDLGEVVFQKLFDLSPTMPTGPAEQHSTRWVYTEDEGWLVCDELRSIAGKNPRWEGAIMRPKSKDLGYIVDADGKRALGDTLGPRASYSDRYVAFLFDCTTGLLWLQRAKGTVGRESFVDYLSERTNLPLGMKMLLRDDAIARAEQFDVLKTLKFSYYRDSAGAHELEEFINVSDQLGHVKVNVTLSAPRGQLGRSARRLLKRVTGLVRRDGDKTIKSASLEGAVEDIDEDWMPVDLFRDRNSFSKDLALERTREPAKLIEAVRWIWANNRENVEEETEPT